MKRIVPLILVLCLLLPLLFGCDTEKPVYTKHLPARTEDISWEDRMTEDAITVSSVLSYSREEIDLPGGATIIGMQKYTYAAEDGLYIPIKKYSAGQYTYRTVIYHYGTDGQLIREIEIPHETECAELFRVLSDGTILLLQTRTAFDFSKVFLQMIDKDGTVRCESPEFIFSESVQLQIDNNAHGMHVTERADGTLRILVNAIDRVYYFDESLALLSEVRLPAECKGIMPLDDDVYMIGSEMPSVCKVDLKNGTAEQTDVPVLPEMKYFSTFHYGGDGQLYCAYKDSVYLCQKDDTGGDSMHQLLNWYQGACDGQGFYWIANKDCIFYIPLTSISRKKALYLLKPGTSPDNRNRRVLTFVNLCGFDTSEWFLEAVALFNQENNDYYIQYVDMARIVDGRQTLDRFDEYLLNGNKPDLVLFNLGYRKYMEKNLLLDLSDDYGNKLIGAARNAYTEGNGALYALPMAMSVYSYACKTSCLDAPLTWDWLYTVGKELDTNARAPHTALTSKDNTATHLNALIRQYVNYETMTSSFHSDEFHRQVEFLVDMTDRYIIEDYGTFHNSDFSSSGLYALLGGTEIVSAIQDDRVLLSYFPFKSIEGYASLKLFFGDTPFSLCGYPTVSSNSYEIEVGSQGSLAVFAESVNLGGCKEFLDFLLSDDIQASKTLASLALPVTRTAMEILIDENRYFYYPKKPDTIGDLMGGTGTVLLLSALYSSEELNVSLADSHTVIEITDQDKEKILNLLDQSIAFSNPDETLRGIIHEELSAFRAGIRSLEETTKIIDSRVWIYLNE